MARKGTAQLVTGTAHLAVPYRYEEKQEKRYDEGDHRGRSHKLSATIEVVDRHEKLLGTGRFSTDQAGYTAMRTYAKTWPDRTWAIEGSNGAGRPLGNRRMNHMIHIAAISQIRLDGRAYYRRKRAEGKKSLEAIRCLKRRISDAIYRQLLEDP